MSLSRADAGGATTAFWSPLNFKSPQRGCRVVVKYGWGLKRWRGLRFQSPSILNTEGQQTSWGSRARLGQTQAAFHVLHASTEDEAHWHAGISMSAFGASQVPQREFSYLDRTYTLETGSCQTRLALRATRCWGLDVGRRQGVTCLGP